MKMREIYGNENVIATDLRKLEGNPVVTSGPFELLRCN